MKNQIWAYKFEVLPLKIPRGWFQLLPGDTIAGHDKFWHEGTGPWTKYSNPETDSHGNIGNAIVAGMHPVIRQK